MATIVEAETRRGPSRRAHAVLDPNVFIQESKVTTCDVRPGRRPRGPALLAYIAEYRRRAGITAETGTRLDTTRADPAGSEENP